MPLWEGGWRSHSQASNRPHYIAQPRPWQCPGHWIWCLSSICHFRGIVNSLKYSFNGDSFAIDSLGSKVRVHMKFSNFKYMSEFLCSEVLIRFPDHWSTECFSQTQCMLKSKAIWTTGRLVSVHGGRAEILKYHLQFSLGHCGAVSVACAALGEQCHLLIDGTKGSEWFPATPNLHNSFVSSIFLIPEMSPVSRRNKENSLNGINGQSNVLLGYC